jgi:predicted Zn-dependent protease
VILSKMHLQMFILLLFVLNCSGLDPKEKEVNYYAQKTYNKIKAEGKISTRGDWNQLLNRVATQITKASGINYDWEWVLIENKEPNAWCMPGGKIAVYTGIMPVLKNEAGLAVVLGHEVAHATKKHGIQRYARAIRGELLGVVIGATTALGGQIWCKTESCKMLTGLGGAAAGFAITFFDRKFSRSQESESDLLGQVYMARAGYDPEEAARLWERMGELQKGSSSPEFLSTHPSDRSRIEVLRKSLPGAMRVYSDSPIKFGLGEKIE